MLSSLMLRKLLYSSILFKYPNPVSQHLLISLEKQLRWTVKATLNRHDSFGDMKFKCKILFFSTMRKQKK